MNMKESCNYKSGNFSTRQRTCQHFGFGSALGAIVFAASVQAAILSPDAIVEGKSQAEWSALHWKWVAEILWDSAHPWRDRTGLNVQSHESGSVWFLPAANTSQPVTRNMAVPSDTILHVAIAGNECSNIESPPYHGDSEAEMRACAESHPIEMSCEVDGVSVTNLASYITTTPLFPFVLPPVNSFGVPGGGPGEGVACGGNVMLQFPTGGHTVHFQSRYADTGFSNNVTYQLTVYQRPALEIHPGPPPGLISLSWSSTNGFSLQETTGLEMFSSWGAPAVISSGITNGIQFVTVTNAAGNRFFRLNRNG